jgi:predicted dehydrogenase
MSEKLRVGVTGCGLVAQIIHLPYLQELSHLYEVRALATRSSTLLEQIGNQYNIPGRYKDYRDLLDQSLDAVFILNRDHAPIIMDAAAVNKHIFVEKPLCFSLEQAEAIKGAIAQSHVKLMVGYMKRYDPGVEYVSKQIASIEGNSLVRLHHAIGSPFRIADEMYRIQVPDDGPTAIYEAEQQQINKEMFRAIGIENKAYRTAYSLLLHLWSHDLNLLGGIWGQVKSVRHSEVRLGPDTGDVPSIQILAVMDFGEDTSCVWESRAFAKNEWWDEELAVFSDDQTIKIRFPYPYLKNAPAIVQVKKTVENTLREEKITSSYNEAYRRQLIHFHTCNTQDREPLTTVADSCRDIELAVDMIRKNSYDNAC